MTRITAHSGCEGTKPGSMEGIRAAVASGADTMELDLRWYGGEVLLSHDPIRAERQTEYVKLQDVLAQMAGTTVRFNCDLKEEAAFAPALACFRAFEMEDRMEFTGMYPLAQPDADACYQVHLNVENIPGVTESVPLRASAAAQIAVWFEQARTVRHTLAGLNIEIVQLTEESLAVFRAHDIALSCWTVDAPEDLAFCLRAGVANITTNEVRAAFAARQAMHSNPANRLDGQKLHTHG